MGISYGIHGLERHKWILPPKVLRRHWLFERQRELLEHVALEEIKVDLHFLPWRSHIGNCYVCGRLLEKPLPQNECRNPYHQKECKS